MNLRENWVSFFRSICHPIRIGLLLFMAGSFILGLIIYDYYLAPVNVCPQNEKNVLITIAKGSSLQEIGTLLKDAKLIKSKRFFVFFARLTGKEKKIQAGVYRISNMWTMRDILNHLVGGEVALCRFTIPEGYTVSQIKELLHEKGIANKEDFQKALLSGDYAYSFLQETASAECQLEGFLFPATYELPVGLSADEIINVMLQTFEKAFSPDLQQRAQEMGLSISKVATLASLVEREAKLDAERPLIAAVFLNRIERGMRLESCATIQYLLGKPKETLTYEDLLVPSPYNTYLNEGLPPGPIANPGLASIKAVLYPAQKDYLYFVARGDGSHYFSQNLSEHQTATNLYITNKNQ